MEVKWSGRAKERVVTQDPVSLMCVTSSRMEDTRDVKEKGIWVKQWPLFEKDV